MTTTIQHARDARIKALKVNDSVREPHLLDTIRRIDDAATSGHFSIEVNPPTKEIADYVIGKISPQGYKITSLYEGQRNKFSWDERSPFSYTISW